MSSPKAGRGQGKFPANVGQKVGIEIFRIENMNPVAIDSKDYGNFYGGDCYIILHTYEVKNSRCWNLHFWLGDESSKDEHGAVAYRTVELDDLLGGKPVQMRHTQGHEGPELVSLFKNGVKVLKGGVDSAFTKVDPDKYDPRLFHLKGKRVVTVKQVELKSSSLNHGDCFILDLGKKLFQWNGKESNKYEKVKTLQVITDIRNQHGGPAKCELFILEGTDQKQNGADIFWKTLGDVKHVKSASEGGDDDAVKQATPKLFQVSDASGKLEVNLIAEGKLEKKMLDEKDCFILDTGNGVHVWVGKGATKQERAKSMEYATQYIKDNNLPAWLPISRVGQGGESATFKGFFNWPSDPVKKGGEKKEEKKKDDTSALFSKGGQEEEKMVDKGDGKVEIWRIHNFDKVNVPKEQYGQFYGGDSYIILYTYEINKKPAWIIYFWQGNQSTSDEKGASALLTKQMDDEKGGEPVQVRIEQGREPNHFLTLFKGKMVVHQGGYASAFKSKKETDTAVDSKAAHLYHIKGTNAYNTKAVEVDPVASNLNSGDVFGLLLSEVVYIWAGKGSNKEENIVASTCLKPLIGGRKVVNVAEGSEPDDFWEALGGKAEYASAKESVEGQRDPRLFQCSNVTGSFKLTEVFNFVQDDLISDDVMILDLFTDVFVWIGKDSQKEEKDKAMMTAMDFVSKSTDGRSKSTPIWKVNAGLEPPNFTACFQGWDSKKAAAAGGDVYARALAEAKTSGGEKKINSPTAVSASDIGYLDWNKHHFPIEKLLTGVTLPDKVEAGKRELYLSDAEFEKLFKVKKDSWLSQPAWKRDQEKKKHKLF